VWSDITTKKRIQDKLFDPSPPPLKIKIVGDAVTSSSPLGLLLASKIKF